jgi:glycine cleavage system aminomethyltransferase T
MKYTRTTKSISFKTRQDHVRIEQQKAGYKIYADAEDREAVYSLSESAATDVAKALKMNIETTFLDFAEAAIQAGKAEELFNQMQTAGTSEFFWMDMDQIDRFMIGGEQPRELDRD